MSLSLVPLKTCRERGLILVKYVESQMSSQWCGQQVTEEGVPAQVSSLSLDHGCKLRGPSPIALFNFIVRRKYNSDLVVSKLTEGNTSTAEVERTQVQKTTAI
ncbi:hypothetical protein TNCV_5058611 [Trichonephila clavipes]|nr:hypothetical protein TNCV_5058611 [Trichonephila clavipes]